VIAFCGWFFFFLIVLTGCAVSQRHPTAAVPALRSATPEAALPAVHTITIAWDPINPPWGMTLQGSTNLLDWFVITAVDSTKGTVTVPRTNPACFYRFAIPYR